MCLDNSVSECPWGRKKTKTNKQKKWRWRNAKKSHLMDCDFKQSPASPDQGEFMRIAAFLSSKYFAFQRQRKASFLDKQHKLSAQTRNRKTGSQAESLHFCFPHCRTGKVDISYYYSRVRAPAHLHKNKSYLQIKTDLLASLGTLFN